jgi:hypothetical protein
MNMSTQKRQHRWSVGKKLGAFAVAATIGLANH